MEGNHRGQTTVPQEIRAALDSKPGDLIAWEVEPDGRVAVRRIQPADVRFKLFTLDHRLVRRTLGRLATKDQAKMQKAMRQLFVEGKRD